MAKGDSEKNTSDIDNAETSTGQICRNCAKLAARISGKEAGYANTLTWKTKH